MKPLPFKKLDAFAVNGSSGNPAGAIYLTGPHQLSPIEMQTIARELGGFVSEVGFLAPLASHHYWIRYYSAEREVAFCGHATIAILYDLIRSTAALRGVPQIALSTQHTHLIVENHVPESDCVFVTAPSPRFAPRTYDRDRLAPVLGTGATNLRDDRPIVQLNAGLETLIVPVQGLEQILSITPDFQELRAFCLDNALDTVTLYSAQVANAQNAYRTRVFAPTFGYLEDPATGSGNAAFGHYLFANDLWDGAMISLEQNRWADRPNIVRLLGRTTAEGKPEVLFGGNAAVKIAGEYLLNPKSV